MAKNNKIPSKSELKKLLKETIHALEYDSLKASTGDGSLSRDELITTLERVRDSALFKLQSNILNDNTFGSSALNTIVDRVQIQIDRLNDNKDGHANKTMTISWSDG